MESEIIKSELAGLQIIGLSVVVLVALALQYLVRKKTSKLTGPGFFALRSAATVFFSWSILFVARRWIDFGAALAWPWFAFFTGIGCEVLKTMYERELKGADPVLARRLVLLRTSVFCVILFVLLQPVWILSFNRDVVRRVVLLLDDSGSMHFEDGLWRSGELLDMMEGFEMEGVGKRPLREYAEPEKAMQKLSYWLRNDELTGNQDRNERLKVLNETQVLLKKWHDESSSGGKPGPSGQLLNNEVSNVALPALTAAISANANDKDAFHQTTRKVVESLQKIAELLPPALVEADDVYWTGLSDELRMETTSLCSTTRVALAERLIGKSHGNKDSFLRRLESRYNLELMRFGRDVERLRPDDVSLNRGEQAEFKKDVIESLLFAPDASSPERERLRSLTDMTYALETVMRTVPGEELAGVLIISDGLHNSDSSIEAVSRRLALQGTKVSGLIVGGSKQPFDLAIADVRSPETVYLGDNVRKRVTVRATGARDRSFKLRLKLDDEVVEEIELKPSLDDWRQEIRLAHEPETEGMMHYTLELEHLEGELFSENNTWSVKVAVSDDRTNVLLVDSYPRWEFRYLRNLFYGRDKSVHLQYMLTNPDMIAGVETPPLPPASAKREFGDASAGAWPVSREEWQEFNVIILGDLDPGSLPPQVLEEIMVAVDERGALLVVIAGRRAMPHAYASGILPELLPVIYGAPADEQAYSLTLTPSGRTHPVMQQSVSVSENDWIWSSIPEMRWRFPVSDIKPGAEVLAYAHPIDEGNLSDAKDVAETLDRVLGLQKRNALIVASNYGRGKVLMLCFDRLWRLRYRVGDTYHHGFWGQALRWGAGELLRDGDENMRVGTNRLLYERDESVRVTARLLKVDTKSAPRRLAARVIMDERVVASFVLSPRDKEPGVYEGTTGPFGEPGSYELSVSVRDQFAPDATISTSFIVVEADRPVEMAKVTADPGVLRQIASITGGITATPSEMNKLENAFGEGSRVIREQIERPLWSNGFLFVLLMLMLTGEWLLRKRGGLT